MSTDEHTSDRTSLGYVLQHLVEDGLNLNSVDFEANCDYYKGFIKPDVLIPGNPPKYSVHVTATGADNSFQMKKWRYVDEVLQMRSVWKNDFLSISTGYENGVRIMTARVWGLFLLLRSTFPGPYPSRYGLICGSK